MPIASAGGQPLDALGTATADVLLARGLSIVTAESCTGGGIAKVLTTIPGSSTGFECGVVVCSCEAKESLPGVQAQTIQRNGAVSQGTVVARVLGPPRVQGHWAQPARQVATIPRSHCESILHGSVSFVWLS